MARRTTIGVSEAKARLSHDQGRVPDSFFDPLPEDEMRAWEGR